MAIGYICPRCKREVVCTETMVSPEATGATESFIPWTADLVYGCPWCSLVMSERPELVEVADLPEED